MAEGRGISRRELLKRAGIGAGGLAVSGVAAPQIWAAPRVSRSRPDDQDRLRQPAHRPGLGFRRAGSVRARAREDRAREGAHDRRNDVHRRGRQQGRAVDAQRRSAGGERPDPLGERRSDAHHLDARGREPGLGRVRGRRRAVHLDRRAVGGLVLRPRREAGQAVAVPLHLPLLLRRRELLRHLHAPVAAGEDEQGRRRDVAERRRRQRDPRRISGRCSRRPATRSSTRAPTRTGRTTTRPRSRSSSRPGSRSSTRSRSRPTSRPSGARPPSRG